MTYATAKNCFKENLTLTGGAQRDPVSFNLYNGLFQLTEQLERDMRATQQQIARLQDEIQSRR